MEYRNAAENWRPPTKILEARLGTNNELNLQILLAGSGIQTPGQPVGKACANEPVFSKIYLG